MDANELLEIGTYNPNDGQKLWWIYYDRAIMAAATLQHQLFTVPLGQAGKTLADTNCTVGGEIPKGQNFEVKGIELYYVSDAAKTVAQLQNVIDMFRDTTLEFIISGKSAQLQANLTILFGSPFTQHVTGGAAGDQLTGRSQFNNMFELPTPIILAAKTNYRIEIQHHIAVNASLADDELLVALVGNLIGLQ